MRFLGALLVGLLVVAGLFLLMSRMVQADHDVPPAQKVIESVRVIEQPTEPELSPDAPLPPLDAPPPPPAPSAALSRPDLPALDLPAPAAPPLEAGPITVPALAGASKGVLGASLSGTGVFGGFAGGGGGGGGSGGAGVGKGEGFKGKPLVPLSTARPQMPEWACKQRIRGWVEVVFTVLPTGRVTDVKLVDAEPKGVFEAAAIESVGHWIYDRHDKARTVKQRVPMNPEDCAYNYQQ